MAWSGLSLSDRAKVRDGRKRRDGRKDIAEEGRPRSSMRNEDLSMKIDTGALAMMRSKARLRRYEKAIRA